MDTFMNYLESIHPLSDGLKTYLAENLKQRRIKKEEYLLKAGQICRHVCFIHTGLVRCFYMEGDEEVSTSFVKEGEVVFSVESFFMQTPSIESIQAREDTFFSYIDYEELRCIYIQFPEFKLMLGELTLHSRKL